MSDIDIRDFFRLEDALPCEYKLISSDQIATQDPETLFDYSEEIQLMAQLKVLQRQGKGLLERIDRQNAEIATYLKNLDQQVELIGRRVLFNEIQTPDNFQSKLVDISVGGAGLFSEALLPEESYVALRVLFDEGAWVLTCFARIRYSRMLNGSNHYRSGIEFVNLPLEYQKRITRYLLNRQTDARRAQIRADQNGDVL
ncbi:MAG: PilZ domain-containing protein [Pseudomonadales bacterium]|nr:PilZ domain-containing protein [Pseudomonadales bacterium]